MWFLQEFFFKKRSGNLPFKMRNMTQSHQQECRESIKEEFTSITRKLPALQVRLRIKDAKANMHQNLKDIFGNPQKVIQPIFTQDELAKFTQNLYIYRAVLFLMVFFESILYSLMASLFIRRQSLNDFAGIEYIFGFSFAIIFVAALHFAFKNMWEFFEAKNSIEKNSYDKKLLKPFYINIILAAIVLTIFIVTNIYTGYIRAIILEPGATSTSSYIEKIHGPLLVFSIAITFIVALVMALLEKEITEKSIKYKVFNNWKRQQKERKEYNTQVKDMLKKCKEKKELQIEKYWGVTLDSQRIFEIEVDADKNELYKELDTEISNKTINLGNLTDDKYQKYVDIAATKLELFRYSIDSDAAIVRSIQDITEVVEEIDKFEHKNASTGETDDSKAENNKD